MPLLGLMRGRSGHWALIVGLAMVLLSQPSAAQDDIDTEDDHDIDIELIGKVLFPSPPPYSIKVPKPAPGFSLADLFDDWPYKAPYKYPNYMKRVYEKLAMAWTFVGYRYAHPVAATDALQPPRSVDGVGKGPLPWVMGDGQHFGTICPQPRSNASVWLETNMEVKSSTDCLLYSLYMPFADVFQNASINPPKPPPAGTYPVYVHIHDGFNSYGSAAEVGRHGVVQQLVRQDTLVVTFSYRLGFYGWLNTGDNTSGPMQRGLRDVEMALAWVRRNVGAFGGDPERITVGGQGTGACLAAILAVKGMTQPGEPQLFQQLLLMSGSASTCLTDSLLPSKSTGESTEIFLKKFCPEVELNDAGVPTNPKAVKECIKGYEERDDLSKLTAKNAVDLDWWGVKLPDGEFPSLSEAYPKLIANTSGYKKLRILAGVGVDAWSRYDHVIRNNPDFKFVSDLNPSTNYSEYMDEVFSNLYPDAFSGERFVEVVMDGYRAQESSPKMIYHRVMRDMLVTMPMLSDLQQLAELGHTIYLYDFNYRGFFHQEMSTDRLDHYSAEEVYFLKPEFMWERVALADRDNTSYYLDLRKELEVASKLRNVFHSFIVDGVPSLASGNKLAPINKDSFINAPYLSIDGKHDPSQKEWKSSTDGTLDTFGPMELFKVGFKSVREHIGLPPVDIKF